MRYDEGVQNWLEEVINAPKKSRTGKQSSGVEDPFIALSGSSQTPLINVLINLLRLLLAVAFFLLESLPRAECPLGWTGLNLRAALDAFYLQGMTWRKWDFLQSPPSLPFVRNGRLIFTRIAVVPSATVNFFLPIFNLFLLLVWCSSAFIPSSLLTPLFVLEVSPNRKGLRWWCAQFAAWLGDLNPPFPCFLLH